MSTSQFQFNNEDTVALHITKQCDMRCKHCYQQNTNYETVADLYKVFESIDLLKPKNIVLYGGEPLLYPDLIERIFDMYPNKGYIIHTNGTIFNKKILDRVNSISLTLETLFFDKQNKYRRLNKNQWETQQKIIDSYKDKIIATHNIYPTENDELFSKVAKLLELKYNTYPVVMATEEYEWSSTMLELDIDRSILLNPKRRILEDGTITRDMQGIYNLFLPVHDKCKLCEFNKYCPALKMFPHFCFGVLCKMRDKTPHFCKMAEDIYKWKTNQFSSK